MIEDAQQPACHDEHTSRCQRKERFVEALSSLPIILIVIGVGVGAIFLGVLTDWRVSHALTDAGIALVTGGLIGWILLTATNEAEDTRARRAERADDLRFVRDFSGPDSRYRPFNGTRLQGQHMDMLELDGARFNEARLDEASMYLIQLAGADLQDASLVCADLYEADLSNSRLVDANLRGADLRKVTFGESTLRGAHFGRPDEDRYGDRAPATDLRGANLSAVTELTPTQLAEAVYDESTLLPPYVAGLVPERTTDHPAVTDEQGNFVIFRRDGPKCSPLEYTPGDGE
jgi:hypothetical protein